jgi:hypothetical protein
MVSFSNLHSILAFCFKIKYTASVVKLHYDEHNGRYRYQYQIHFIVSSSWKQLGGRLARIAYAFLSSKSLGQGSCGKFQMND